MSNPAETTYMASYPKRNDITGAPNQVFKFDNFLTHLIGGIKAAIAAIGTINPGSLCLQYLYDPQIYYNLSGEPIAFIGNSSNKKGKFSIIKINVKSIRAFAYIKDKATWDTNLTRGDDIPKEFLTNIIWKDLDKPLIVGNLIPNFVITYFGQDVPYGDINNDKIMAKLSCLGSGYELWANMAMGALKYINDILSIIDEIKEPDKIKQYLNPTRDDKSLQLAMANGLFGAMTHVQSDNYPVAACVLKEFFQLSPQMPTPPFPSFPSGNVMLQLPSKVDKEPEAKKGIIKLMVFHIHGDINI
jgi:hypothetical protein